MWKFDVAQKPAIDLTAPMQNRKLYQLIDRRWKGERMLFINQSELKFFVKTWIDRIMARSYSIIYEVICVMIARYKRYRPDLYGFGHVWSATQYIHDAEWRSCRPAALCQSRVDLSDCVPR